MLNGNSTLRDGQPSTPKIHREPEVSLSYIWSEQLRLMDQCRDALRGTYPKAAKARDAVSGIHACAHALNVLRSGR